MVTKTVKLQCHICGIKYFKKYRKNKHKFSKTCSDKCFRKLMSRIRSVNKVHKKCCICNKPFITSKIKNRKTCSHKCGYELKKSKTIYVDIKCETCGNIKRVNKKRLIYYKKKKFGSFRFCSIKCALKNTKSGLETIIESIFKSYNIVFEKQYKINKFHYDFFIPSKNLLIECQGDFWHGNLKIFQSLSLKQIKTHEKDERKRICALNHNHKILYIWENDVYNNIYEVMCSLLQHCL